MTYIAIDRFAKLCERKWFCFLLILLSCIVTIIIPIAIGGLHASGDLGVYVSFARDFRDAIGHGEFLPSLGGGSAGYGSLGIRFYPPIAPYVSALISFATNDWYYAIWIYFIGWMLAGCWGTFLFVGEWGTRPQALFAAVLYAIAPFYLAEIYQYSLYAEFAAGAVVPFCFFFVTRICRGRRWIDVAGFAVSFSALILTHIPATMITGLSLLIYVPFVIEWRYLRRIATLLSVASLLSLLASAFYWIKVVAEAQWLAHFGDKYSTGMAGYEQWLFPNWIITRSAPYYYIPIYRNIDALVVLTALLFLPPILFLFTVRKNSNGDRRHLIIASTVTSIFGFFVLSRASWFIWSHFPLLDKIQFPWRWLTVLTFLGTAAFAFSIPFVLNKGGTMSKITAIYIACLISIMLAFDVRQNFMRPNTVTPAKFQEIIKERTAPGETSFAAWWPIWAKGDALRTSERVVAGGRDVQISYWERENCSFTIGKGDPTSVRVAAFYYPYWKATANGRELDVQADENGAIEFSLNAEASEVRLSFQEPYYYSVGLWLSIATWMLLAALIAGRVKMGREGHVGRPT